MDFLLQAHGLVRWVVLLAGFLGILMLWRQGRSSRPVGVLASAFLGFLDLQLLLGALLLVLDAEARSGSWPHVGFMAAAVILGHVLRVRSKKAEAGRALMAATFLVPLVLIGVGLLLL